MNEAKLISFQLLFLYFIMIIGPLDFPLQSFIFYAFKGHHQT